MSAITDAHDAISDVEGLLEVLFDALRSQDEKLFHQHFGNVVKITIDKLMVVEKHIVFAMGEEAKRRAA